MGNWGKMAFLWKFCLVAFALFSYLQRGEIKNGWNSSSRVAILLYFFFPQQETIIVPGSVYSWRFTIIFSNSCISKRRLQNWGFCSNAFKVLHSLKAVQGNCVFSTASSSRKAVKQAAGGNIMKKGRNPKPFLWYQVHKLTPAMGVYAKKVPVSR